MSRRPVVRVNGLFLYECQFADINAPLLGIKMTIGFMTSVRTAIGSFLRLCQQIKLHHRSWFLVADFFFVGIDIIALQWRILRNLPLIKNMLHH